MSFLKKIDWVTTPFFVLTLILSIGGLAVYIPLYGVHPLEPIVTFAFVTVVAFVVSSGYHRYFAHKTYDCHPLLKIFYLVMGSTAFQQSVLVWATDHRRHHRYLDTEKDPYSITKGFWWAHIGWTIAKHVKSRAPQPRNAGDLLRDPWVRLQDRFWLPVGILISLVIPLAIGFWIGRPVGMLLWAGLLRIVITHHTTFTINSVTHKFGSQPYSDQTTARDVWWVAPLLWGENYHNYHHTFQGDYRNGIRWYHWDPSKWVLWTLNHTPLVARLHRASPHLIWKARAAMDFKRLEAKLNKPSCEIWLPLQEVLLKTREALEETSIRYANALKNYQEFKSQMANRSRQSLIQARQALKEKKRAFEEMLHAWQEMVRLASQGLAPAWVPIAPS